MVIHNNKPGIDTYNVWVEVSYEKAKRVRAYEAMILNEFNCIKFSAVAMPASMNGDLVVSIVNTGSAGVVISNFFWFYGNDHWQWSRVHNPTASEKKIWKWVNFLLV